MSGVKAHIRDDAGDFGCRRCCGSCVVCGSCVARVLQEEKTSILRQKISELGPKMDLWNLARTRDGCKLPAKPGEPEQARNAVKPSPTEKR